MKERQIKCIALDLDRTTLRSDGTLSPGNKAALEKAIAGGLHVIIASGRALDTLPADVLAIPGIRYAVTSNGAAIYDLHTGSCLKKYRLTEESVRKILLLTEDMPIAYETFINGKPFAQKSYIEDPVKYGATPRAISYIQSTREPVEDIRGFILTHIHELDGIDLVVHQGMQKEQVWQLLKEQVPDVYITSSVEQLLEISYKDCGKHSGAGFLLEYLEMSREELAAFGDADNDADLLRYAGLGIAVANASENCRAAADYITLSNDEDGVARGIAYILDGVNEDLPVQPANVQK